MWDDARAFFVPSSSSLAFLQGSQIFEASRVPHLGTHAYKCGSAVLPSVFHIPTFGNTSVRMWDVLVRLFSSLFFLNFPSGFPHLAIQVAKCGTALLLSFPSSASLPFSNRQGQKGGGGGPPWGIQWNHLKKNCFVTFGLFVFEVVFRRVFH